MPFEQFRHTFVKKALALLTAAPLTLGPSAPAFGAPIRRAQRQQQPIPLHRFNI